MKTVAAQHNSTHNPEVAGSNPVPATKKARSGDVSSGLVLFLSGPSPYFSEVPDY
jgi:hypothetical protein